MVAKTAKLPNLKRMFLPDPGFFICDSDLAQADAQVVAWDANDVPLMDFFKEARTNPELDLHGSNASDIFGGPPTKENKHRSQAKAGVHAVNYDAKARTLARTLGVELYDAEKFIDTWFTKHPAIHAWKEEIKTQLQTTRIITNRFGNRRIYRGRLTTPTALSEALAWIPQSTVALVINRAWATLDALDDETRGDIFVSLQVHDSLVYQVRKRTFRRHLPAIEEAFNVPIPYPDPLVIPAGLEYSDKSWGDAKASDWQGNFE